MMTTYLVQAGDDGPVLLGLADHRALRRKVASLQKANAQLLHVRAQLDGDERLERRLHTLFAEHHVLGDWYSADVLEALPTDVTRLPVEGGVSEDQRLAQAEIEHLLRRAS